MSKRALVPVALISSTLLSGCLLVGQSGGQADSPSAAAPTTTATQATVTPTSAAPTAPTSNPAPDPTVSLPLPAGFKWVVLSAEEVKFGVAESWTEVDPTALNSMSDKAKEAFKPMADAAGVTVDEFVKAAAKSSLRMVMAPPVKGFSANINVVSMPFKTLPPASLLEPQLKAFGATIESTGTTTIPFGEALLIKYSLVMQGQTVHQRMLVVTTGDTGLAFSVTGISAADADKHLATLSDTLSGN